MSLIEDLSNPLSRLIVYLCLSLIGLKKGLLPWSIQRGEKSNHFSLCLSFFVSVFLFSFFSLQPFSAHDVFFSAFFSLSFLTPPILHRIFLHIFVLSALLSSLPYFSLPNWSFSIHSFTCLATLVFFPPLASFSISFWVSLSSIFSTLQTDCNKPYIKSEMVSSPERAAWFGKKTFCVNIFAKRNKTAGSN